MRIPDGQTYLFMHKYTELLYAQQYIQDLLAIVQTTYQASARSQHAQLLLT